MSTETTPAARVEGQLAAGELEVIGLLPRASNNTFLARVDGGSEPLLAVYKPREGETPLWDFPDGTLAARETAAYLVARSLGWPDVPPTVLRDGPLGPGAVQLFIEADPAEHFFTLRETRLRDFRPVALFDAVVNNADRKSGHCLLDPEGRIWSIDHGLCFHPEPKLRTVIWEFAEEPIPTEMCADLERLVGELGGSLGMRLRELLPAGEVEETMRRAGRFLREGRFPRPGGGRAVPWPPV